LAEASKTTEAPTSTPAVATSLPTFAPTPSPAPAPATPFLTATPTPTLEAGRLVDVGAYRLHVRCTGEGSPIVVLDAGYSSGHSEWYEIRPEVAAFTRVCAYDRASREQSDYGPWTAENPNTALQMVKDLSSLLRGAQLDAPYVLAGASFGGMVARLYGSTYPADVVGMVLVDAATEEVYDDLGTGIVQNVNIKASADQVRNAGPFPNIPLIVLTHGEPRKRPLTGVDEERWQEFQLHLLKLSPQSKQIIAEKSGHAIIGDQPQLVVDAIREVVGEVRRK
jgi:pimeloyl-ACP methyl ester carboxylesterase